MLKAPATAAAAPSPTASPTLTSSLPSSPPPPASLDSPPSSSKNAGPLLAPFPQHRQRSRSSPRRSLFGIALITLGSLCFSAMFLFVKLLQGRTDSFTLAFYRALVEIPLALVMCLRSGENPLGPSPSPEGARGRTILVGTASIRFWLCVRGGAGAVAVLCFFYAIQHLPLPDAVTLQFTTPPFAAAFAVLLVGERWSPLDAVGAVVCLAGVVLIAHPSWLFGRDEGEDEDGDNKDGGSPAIVVALLGAALGGLAYTSVRKIGHSASANVMVLYYGVFSLPVTLVGSRGFLGSWDVWSGGGDLASSPASVALVAMTGLSAYGGQFLTNLGLQHETAATGTLATCSQIVFTYAFELAILHEELNLWSLCGSALIVGFMVVVGLFKMREADETIKETVAGEPEELALMFSAQRDVLAR